MKVHTLAMLFAFWLAIIGAALTFAGMSNASGYATLFRGIVAIVTAALAISIAVFIRYRKLLPLAALTWVLSAYALLDMLLRSTGFGPLLLLFSSPT